LVASVRPTSPRVATITLKPFSRPICIMMRANETSSSMTSSTRSSSSMLARSSSIGRVTIGSGSASVVGMTTSAKLAVRGAQALTAARASSAAVT
jgi:hypothetical protein